MARICSNGIEVGVARKGNLKSDQLVNTHLNHNFLVKQGDVLECLVDCVEGFAEIYNNKELVYKFDIPSCQFSEYQFSLTFANDHCAAICSSTSSKTNIYGIIALGLNVDHHEHYECFKRLLRSLLNNFPIIFSIDFIVQNSNSFESRHEKDDLIVEVQNVLNIIELLLHKKKLTNPGGGYNSQISWNEIFGAACYYYLNQNQIEKKRLNDLSARFQSEHGNNSCYIAASIVSNKNEYGEGLRAAVAFITTHVEMMDEWYCYNAAMTDPLISVFKDIGCSCVPRCLGVCSNSSVEQANKIKAMKN